MDLDELNNLMLKYRNEGKDKIAKNLENLIEYVRKQGEKPQTQNTQNNNVKEKQ
ncbi:MAG: hypothetical protein M1124_00535 [Candidatus Marsarchaeota archaeon]|jgi:hypothetical protein|nr:hypothetical protein [Candidatus Marsarchaeota archaeon]